MRLHERFEWDEAKAQANAHKHGVTFDQAAEVLLDDAGDRLHLEEYDAAHAADEERYITTSSHPRLRSLVLVICWTERSSKDGPVTRIISARCATKAERRRYDSEVL